MFPRSQHSCPDRSVRLALFGVVWTLCGAAIADNPVKIPENIAGILQTHCCECHRDQNRKGGLQLDQLQGILTGGESGPVVDFRQLKESHLLQKIESGEMPPEDQPRLLPDEVRVIRNWILDEAFWSEASHASQATNSDHEVFPILLRRCIVCHGRHRQEGKLDLRTHASMLKGGQSGAIVVRGEPEKSLLIQKMRSGAMPPHDRLVEVSIKPIEPREVEVLAEWIKRGASDFVPPMPGPSEDPDTLVTAADREFWSFKSPRLPSIPDVRASDAKSTEVSNPVDAFLLQKLHERGLEYSPAADKATLIRRATYDLTGLPPDPNDVVTFLEDPSAQAWTKVVDRLLASAEYGEHQARRWLDLAGYADSEGKREQDLPRPHAWRYRDYVIRSLNADKPFDRFLQEQLAGDELVDYENAAEITPEMSDCLIATGFLRMVPDATWANITGYVPDRIEVISDEMDVLGSAVMGLSLKCARCHSHKFDPIPQRDYYRVLAVFRPALDEYDWLKPDVKAGLGPVSVDTMSGRLLPFVPTAERRAWEEHEAVVNQRVADAKARNVSAEDIRAIESQRKPEPLVQALWDRGEPTPVYVYRRGDPLNAGEVVSPGAPSVLSGTNGDLDIQPPRPGAKSTGRRLAFARWLTRPDHPLTSRVQMNYMWKQHFGHGIVKTLANFGKTGTPPSHPELLDWLACEFVRNNWSLKSMHRLMMTSRAYQQSSSLEGDRLAKDPDNQLISRMPMTRLSAEELYDAMLVVSGRLDPTPFGPADPVQARPDGLITPSATAKGWRRMIYVQQARKNQVTHQENFDFPQMNPNCVERRDSLVAPQALHLMNNGMVFQLADAMAERILREADTEPAKHIERITWLTQGRAPSAEEQQLGIETLRQLKDEWIASSITPGTQPASDAEVARKALSTYCHAVFNSAGFLYVD